MGDRETERRLAMFQQLLGAGPTRRARLDILVFWGRHPGGWYSRAAITPWTRLSRQAIQCALQELVGEGIVETEGQWPEVYYRLAQDTENLALVKQLASLTPNERRLVLHHLKRADEEDGRQRISDGWRRRLAEAQ